MANSGTNIFALVEITSVAIHSLLRSSFPFYYDLAISNVYQADLEIFYFSHA